MRPIESRPSGRRANGVVAVARALGAAATLLAVVTGVAALAVPPVAVAAVAFAACWLAALGAAHLLAWALGRR